MSGVIRSCWFETTSVTSRNVSLGAVARDVARAARRGRRVPQDDGGAEHGDHRRAQRVRVGDRPLPAAARRRRAPRPEDAQLARVSQVDQRAGDAREAAGQEGRGLVRGGREVLPGRDQRRGGAGGGGGDGRVVKG